MELNLNPQFVALLDKIQNYYEQKDKNQNENKNKKHWRNKQWEYRLNKKVLFK